MPGQPRVVSLVPSITELLFALGAGERVVGRTRFCTEPADRVPAVRIVGGTKNPVVDRIVELAPDLVIANREENRREDVEALQAAGLDVLVTDPNDVPGAISMVREIGAAVGTAAAAERLAGEVEAALAKASDLPRRPRVCVFVWKSPWMVLGSATYGHDLVERCGGTNVFAGSPRYPETTLDAIRAAQPDLLLVPDEPYPFGEADLPELQSIAPARLLDGRLLWWYGPRMPAAIRVLSAMFREAASH